MGTSPWYSLVYEKTGAITDAAQQAIASFKRRTGLEATELLVNPAHSTDFPTGLFNGIQVKLNGQVPPNNVMAGRSAVSTDEFIVKRA